MFDPSRSGSASVELIDGDAPSLGIGCLGDELLENQGVFALKPLDLCDGVITGSA